MSLNNVGEDSFSHLLNIIQEQAGSFGIDLPPDLIPQPPLEIINNREVTINHNNEDIEEIEVIEIEEEQDISQELVLLEWSYYTNGVKTDAVSYVMPPIKIFIECMNKLKYNYELESISKRSIIVIIYFKEKTIKNSLLETRKLTNIFIRISLLMDYNWYRFKLLQIKRSTITDIEQVNSYCHSHSTGYNFSFQDTCLGDGIFDTYRLDRVIEFNDFKYSTIEMEGFSFFNAIESWIEWESLEGTPYQKMRSISINRPISLSAYSSRIFNSLGINDLYKKPIKECLTSFNPVVLYLFKLVFTNLTENIFIVNNNIIFSIDDEILNENIFESLEVKNYLNTVIEDITRLDIAYFKKNNSLYTFKDIIHKKLNQDTIVQELDTAMQIISKNPSGEYFKNMPINNIIIKDKQIENTNYNDYKFHINPTLLEDFKNLIVINYHKYKIIP